MNVETFKYDNRIVRAFGVDYAHVRPPGGGDLYVTVTAQLPTRLRPRERELFEELRRIKDQAA